MYRDIWNFHLGKRELLRVMALLCFSLMFIIEGCSDKEIVFTHEKWVAAKKHETWDVRQGMAQDLIVHQTLIAKNKDEIIQLLGTPEEYSDAKNDLYYTIDLFYGTDIDPVRIEYLIITLDSKDKVTKYIRSIVLDKT